MLGIAQELFPVVVALYLLDCVAYLGPGHLLFVSTLGRRFTLKRSGLRWAGLLPTALTFSAHRLSIGLTSRGLYLPICRELSRAGRFRRGSFSFRPYEEISAVETESRSVRIDGTVVVKLPSTAHAAVLVERIGRLRGLAAEERRHRIEGWLEQAVDLEAMGARRAAFRRFTPLLIPLSGSLFVASFLLLPTGLYVERLPAARLPVLLWFLLLNYGVLVVATAQVASRLRRAGLLRSWEGLAPLILAPPSAMRARVKLARDLLYEFDPLALAAALLPQPRFVELARAELFGAGGALSASPEPAWQEFWQDRSRQLRLLLEAMDMEEADLLAAPERRDSSAVSWCPLCGGEYREGFRICEGCEVELMPCDPPERRQQP
jgi:hypothetical protein